MKIQLNSLCSWGNSLGLLCAISCLQAWRLVQGVPRLSPKVSWDRLQAPETLTDKRLQKMNE